MNQRRWLGDGRRRNARRDAQPSTTIGNNREQPRVSAAIIFHSHKANRVLAQWDGGAPRDAGSTAGRDNSAFGFCPIPPCSAQQSLGRTSDRTARERHTNTADRRLARRMGGGQVDGWPDAWVGTSCRIGQGPLGKLCMHAGRLLG